MRLVSVLMPAHNASESIGEAIRSVLAQSYAALELIVCDDASTDSTRQVAASFCDPRVRVIHNDVNIGSLQTRNRMAQLARGEYIAWQDADDVSHPERIGRQVAFLDAHADVALCGTGFVRGFDGWRQQIVSRYPTSDEAIRRHIELLRDVPFCAPSTMVRREIFLHTGGMREFFDGIGWYDFDFILRVSERRAVANLPEALYEYRYLSGSQSRAAVPQRSEKLFVQEIGFFLATQRARDGCDALMPAGDRDALDAFLQELRARAGRDPSLGLRRQCLNFVSNRDYPNARRAAWQALCTDPFAVRNYAAAARVGASFCRNAVVLPFRPAHAADSWPCGKQ
jgi:glycosyltransferase involved in cell wall biosynthesis